MTTKGASDGNNINEEFIKCIHHQHKLLLARLVEACIMGAEYATASRDGEVVVFTEHFARGFGLPTSTFFRRFVTHFVLQPHYLGTNAILLLASFISLCEGYLGTQTCVDL
ncbi:hypothetical protein D1007_53738 [Hordeum vulgare]|nr:hypothetical protein D1007_53738 [Hordeum vulgare]